MTEQTMTWPARLRDIALNLRRMGFPISSPSLEQMATLWEQDCAALEAEQRTRLAMTRAWQKNEAALEQARALLAELAACGYECQAGALENNAAYRELAALLSPAAGGAA